MCEESKGRSLLLNIPYNNTLVIRARCKSFTVYRGCNFPYPTLMSNIGSLAVACTYLPKPNRLISGAR